MGKWTKYLRRYCVEWEADPRLKDWLRPIQGELTKAYCRFCRTVLRAHHSDLLVHTGRRKHIRNTARFLTYCNLKNVGDSTSDNQGDGLDTHLCGKCGTRFNSLSSFIYHKVEEEGYRLMYSPSERNNSLILPNLLKDSNETLLNSSTFPDTNAIGQMQPVVTSVSVTVASLPESFSDDERCFGTDEETDWEDPTADRDTNDSQETNEGANYSDESDKVKEYFACCFCDKLFESLKLTQVHLAKRHQAILDGDGDLIDDGEDTDAEDDLKEIETDTEDCEDNFECSSCGAKFKKLSVLKAHQLTHTDIRIHACTYPNCTYSFKTKGSLERHMRRHTGERPYVCNLCGRKFSESGILARHLKSQTPCTMKSDAEFPRYGKQLKLLTENEVPTEVNQLDVPTSGNELICENNSVSISSNPIELSEQNLPDEDRNFTTMKENLDRNDGNLKSNDESSFLVLPPSPSTNQQLENKCSACHKSFESLDELKNHLILHLSSESFHCNVCDYLAKDEIDLIEHHNKQHSHYNIDNQDEAQLPPDESIIIDKEILENGSANTIGLSKVVEKQLAEIENISLKDSANSISETFTCNICKKIFKSGVYFRLHMKMHENSDSKRFQCTACDKSFWLKDGLRKHMKCHSKSKFMCAVCGKMYKTISHAKEHMRAHTSERPFVCNLCDKGFKSKNGLKVHARTHTDDYPYSCSFCECRFREKPALVRHIRTHTGEKPFSCKHCGRSFAEHGTLNRHLRAKVPCTAQRKTKKGENDTVTSIQSVYDSNQPNIVDMVTTENTPDSFQNLTSADGQQYIIASGDDKEILSDTPQVDITGTLPVSDFEGLNAGSYIIISQSDGTSEAVVAEFPIGNVTFVPESEGEAITLNKEV